MGSYLKIPNILYDTETVIGAHVLCAGAPHTVTYLTVTPVAPLCGLEWPAMAGLTCWGAPKPSLLWGPYSNPQTPVSIVYVIAHRAQIMVASLFIPQTN